jgi:dipeptidyl-peptidase 4
MTTSTRWRPGRRVLAIPAVLVAVAMAVPAVAQDRLPSYPGYDAYTRLTPQIQQAVQSGAISARWADDGSSFTYQHAGKWWRYDVAAQQAAEFTPAEDAGNGRGGRRGGPERGRQFESATSPDSTLRAFYRDRNLWVSNVDGSDERQLTTDGSVEKRTKNGTGSWVYGEELGQNTAMWWSPDSRKIAYYRFDESPVPDYFLQLDQTKLQSTMDIEAYPKAGVDNPIVQVFVHDLDTGTTTEIDIRDGKPFTDDVVGHYAYNVGWTPDGSEITLNRTNRRQNIMEFTACTPATGACRVVVREEWPTGWVENEPPMHYLEDGQRFLWISERTGFANIYLYDLSGKLLATLTSHPFEVGGIEHVDEDAGVVWYTARSGDNYLKVQLHRVGLDGKGDRRLTDPAFHHAITFAPDGRHFVDVAQTHDTPPVSRLAAADGRVVAEIANSDISGLADIGVEPAEMFTYTAADGVTELPAMLHKPANFDPTRKYPVLVSVYGGPATNGARETFTTPHPYTGFGFLVLTLDGRNSAGRGKKALDAIYEKLGVVEIDDMAAAVRGLAQRPYVDASRVGIFGTSYGGYASAMALLRHPDVFHAGAAMSPVTDWKHYDTIYTERYMYTPQDNPEGYRAGSAMTYAANLKGRLMIYWGTADNNVHPNNAMELIAALQRAGKSFEVQVGPDRGHTALNGDRMMEFFIENLILRPAATTTF